MYEKWFQISNRLCYSKLKNFFFHDSLWFWAIFELPTFLFELFKFSIILFLFVLLFLTETAITTATISQFCFFELFEKFQTPFMKLLWLGILIMWCSWNFLSNVSRAKRKNSEVNLEKIKNKNSTLWFPISCTSNLI